MSDNLMKEVLNDIGSVSPKNEVMLILRGIKNLLHEEPAKQYAIKCGYIPEVLDASGETGTYSVQTNAAIKRIQKGNGDIRAIYGFSGGGYNAAHIWERLNDEHKSQIKKIVVLGSPGVDPDRFKGVPDVTVYNDPKVPHMDQPDNFLNLKFPSGKDDAKN